MNQKIAQRILDQFVAMSARVGHCLDERWILHNLMPTLNPKEQGEINSTIDELQTRGLVKVENRTSLALVLTDAGYDAIYPSDPIGSTAKIKRAILDGFSDMEAKVGHCLDDRWILHKLKPTLNPKEQDLVASTIDAMVAEGMIEVNQRMGMATLALTQKGFDAIY